MADNDKPEDTAAPADVEETSPETADVPETGADPADVPETDAGPEDTPDVAETDETPALEPDVAETEPTSAPEPADPEEAATAAPPDSAPDPAAVAAAPGATTEPEPEKAAPKRKPRTDAQKAKRKADDARRKAAIKEAQANAPDLEDDPEAEKKAAIREELQAVADDMLEAEAHLDKCRARTKELLAELYPAMKANDRHVDAVRGYVASQKNMRANRALAPARLKAMLEAAGKSPIDAAFSTQRARGFARPTRKPQGIPEGDSAGSQE